MLANKLQYPALATVPVSAVLLHRVDAISPDQTLGDAAQLVARGTGPLPVIDHGRALGVMTRDALTDALIASGPRASISAASCREVMTVDPSTPASEVLERLRSMPDAVVLVVDHGSPVGFVTEDQLAAYLSFDAHSA
ncbi:hypothetical protein BH11MYX3_BH11MYX3_35070 [soil metagenome]